MSETAKVPAQQTTRERVRGFVGTLPPSNRYYLISLAKDAAGRHDKHLLHDAITELREAAADESVGRITLLVLYDSEP